MLEKIAQSGLAKFIGSLINSKTLGKQIDKVMELYEANAFMQAAKRLFVWVVIIIVVGTIIDLVFYWLRPEQKERLEHIKARIARFLDMVTKRINSSQNKRHKRK